MNAILLLLLLFLIIVRVQTWEYCKFEKELCADPKKPHHVMCGGSDLFEDKPKLTSDNFHSHIPATKVYRDYVLTIINTWRDQVAGGLIANLPKAAKMRELVWDYELEFLARKHNANTNMVMDKCRSTKRFPLAGQYAGGYSLAQFVEPTLFYVNKSLLMMWDTKSMVTEPKEWPLNKKQSPGALFAQLVMDRSSRVGCTSSVSLNCSDGSKTHPYCVLTTCNYDYSFAKKRVIYTPNDASAGGECSDWGGAGISENYPNLCANDGSLYPDKVKE